MASEAQISRLMEAWYAAALNPALTVLAMARLKAALGEARGACGLFASPRDLTLFHGDCEPAYELTFFDPSLDNPITPRLIAHGRAETFTEAALMSRRDFHRTPFFNEWLLPQRAQGVLVTKVPIEEGLSMVIALYRDARGREAAFGPGETGLLARLAPVLADVARLRARFSLDGAVSAGRMILDAGGRVVALTPEAERIVADARSGLGLVQRRLLAHDAALQANIDRLVARARGAHPGESPRAGELIARPTVPGGPLILLTLAPLAGAAGDLPAPRAVLARIEDLTLRSSPDFEARLRALLGLTPREARLAGALATGCSLNVHSAGQGVSLETTRTHLRGLFAKTGTHRQVELVALLSRLAPR